MTAIITWNCSNDDESCDNCLTLDGQEFTIQTLPGWPGDGSFGNDILCEGGPRCRCGLTYSDSSDNTATGGSGLAEQWNNGNLQAQLGPAGQIAQWTAGMQAFTDALPDVVMPNEVYSAQARAVMRVSVRQQLAQELGIHPADVPASLVADRVPAVYKAMKGTIKVVYQMLSKTYPDKAIEWIGQMDWGYRQAVPVEDISVTGPSSESDAKSIAKKVKKIKKGKPIKPLILIYPGDDGLLQVADGHHRCAAAVETDTKTVPAYVGKPHTDDDWRREIMDMQMVRAKKMHGTPGGTFDVIEPAGTLNGWPDFESSGTGPTSDLFEPGGVVGGLGVAGVTSPFARGMVEDPSDDPVAKPMGVANKDFGLSSPLGSGFVPFNLSGPEIDIKFAGLLLMAYDSGRVLMIQRYLDENDEAAGMWEFPGGHLENDESPLDAAVREWQEEVGSELPPFKVLGQWMNVNGYQGFFGICRSESDILLRDRDVVNPDDPDQDNPEAVAWFYPSDLASMPGVRRETRDCTPWSLIATKAPQRV